MECSKGSTIYTICFVKILLKNLLYFRRHRPKLIFGDRNDTDCVMRVSGKDYRGIDNLRAKIINLATGSEIPPNTTYPLFRGHLGSPIPEIRLRIREIVRETRENFHVISYVSLRFLVIDL